MEKKQLSMFTSTVKFCDDVIFIKPFCDFFGINYRNQCRVIERDPILKTSSTKRYSLLVFGDKRERLAVTKRAFITWILKLNDQIVHISLREKLRDYQTLIFDFMFGSIDREESIRKTYDRLNKLKRLKNKISDEIRKCDRDIASYLQGKFGQTSLQFFNPKQIG